MFALKKLTYKSKPVIYITNNYYTWKGGDTFEKFREFNEFDKHDVIILGSSRAYRGYSPLLFQKYGYKCFNLGTSAQTIKNTYFTLKHFVTTSNCKLVIVDVFAGAFVKDQLESTSDLIENISKSKAAYDIAFYNADFRTLNMAVLRYLTEKDSPYFTTDSRNICGYTSKNDSLPKEKRMKIYLKERIMFPKTEIDFEQIGYFDKLLKFCNNNSIKVVCVYSPTSYFYDRELHKLFVSRINSITRSNNTIFYDYSILKGISTINHFYDDSHLNEAGVNIFNEVLIKQLIEDDLLTKNEIN